jgi:mRNA interferase RelE/StbE
VKTEYRKRFLKELADIPSHHRTPIEEFVFETVPNLKTIFESGKVEAMTGYPGYYKVRFGDYRIGLSIVADTVIFERVLHRKEIYRHFP